MTNGTGPHLAAAFFCERVLQEQDGVLSAIRLIDRLTRVQTGPQAPPDMEPFAHILTILIVFKSGQARGRFTVTLQPETPAGVQLDAVDLPVQLSGGEEQGANIVLNIPFTFEQEGLYWFDVSFEGNLVTRMPMRVLYQPQPQSRGQTSP